MTDIKTKVKKSILLPEIQWEKLNHVKKDLNKKGSVATWADVIDELYDIYQLYHFREDDMEEIQRLTEIVNTVKRIGL